MGSFIPSYHFDNPITKLTKEWCMKAINYEWYNNNVKSLLWDKNVKEIEDYATGNINMRPFLEMYKSLKTSLANVDKAMEGYKSSYHDKNGMIFEPFPMITEKINSAVSALSKIPLEISARANDPLAIQKKEQDVLFLKNKPRIEADLQEVADGLDLGKVDLGTTKNSAQKYSDSPFGLDLDNPEEEEIFVNLLYALKIESSYETALQYFQQIKNVLQYKRLEIIDQLYFAVSTNRSYQNALTGFPDIEYIHPSSVECAHSFLSDYSDVPAIFHPMVCTPIQLFNYFKDEIGDETNLENIITGKVTGYCACNNLSNYSYGNFDSAKICLKYVEVKSPDWVGLSDPKKSKKGYQYLTTDEKEATEKVWAQNTYCFYWLVGTQYVFNIQKLGFSQRTKGQESYQNFTTNIYRSHKKSAVELAIGENKKAQRADIKLQHAVIKSLPTGRYIDLRFLRNGLTGTTDGINPEAMQRVLDMAMEQNVILADTTDFDGNNDGQFKPVFELKGGLGQEIIGYANIIVQCDNNISRIMGINAQLTGQSANPEGLIGLQKLLINSSLNSLYYIVEAINNQYQKVFSIWGSIIKNVIEEGGAAKKGLIDIIGKKKVDIIDGFEDANLHDVGIFINTGQREEERAKLDGIVAKLLANNILSLSDYFMGESIDNPRDKYAYYATKEMKAKKEAAILGEQRFQQQQQLLQQQGQNVVASKEAEAKGERDLAYAKGDVQMRITQLAGELGINRIQLEGLIKKQINSERNRGQLDKSIATITAKNNAEQQTSLI